MMARFLLVVLICAVTGVRADSHEALPPPAKESIVFVGAHPDDTEGFAATTLHAVKRLGFRVQVYFYEFSFQTEPGNEATRCRVSGTVRGGRMDLRANDAPVVGRRIKGEYPSWL